MWALFDDPWNLEYDPADEEDTSPTMWRPPLLWEEGGR